MQNHTTRSSENGNEYITKSTLRAELEEAFEKFAQFLEGKFGNIYKRLDTIESTMVTKQDLKRELKRELKQELENELAGFATKQDIMQLRDSFVPNYKFDELSLRVHALEEKNA